MLTGPVTLYKWAFPPQEESLRQDVVNGLGLGPPPGGAWNLEAQGIGIIQIDEPAYREVLPAEDQGMEQRP
jgi:5-methyltetrahydropteroyltriglutamate--homocysteine methyltransferase